MSGSISSLNLPANATDALVRASIVTRSLRDGYAIVRAPKRPDYWFANCLVLAHAPAPESYAHWIALHAVTFEGHPVTRRVIVWEVNGRTGLPPYDGPIERERTTVFRVRAMQTHLSSNPHIREFDDLSDWQAAAAMERAALIGDGLAGRVDFAAWRFGIYRADAARRRCRVWGAFPDDRLIAYAGLYADDRYARFITPVTEPTFRRQGLFRALCSVAVAETARTHPRALVIIVAKSGEDPERIYERLGFDAIGEQHALIGSVTP